MFYKLGLLVSNEQNKRRSPPGGSQTISKWNKKAGRLRTYHKAFCAERLVTLFQITSANRQLAYELAPTSSHEPPCWNCRGDDGWTRLSLASARASFHNRIASHRDIASLADIAHRRSRVTQRRAYSQADRAQTAEHKEMCIINFCRFIPGGSNLESMQVNTYHSWNIIKPVTSWLTLLKVLCEYGRRPSGPGSSPGRGHRVVFLDKTLYSNGASLHPGVNVPETLEPGWPCHELALE